MEAILTPAAMAEADARTIAAGTPVDVLMERAGRAVAWASRRLVGGCYGRRAVVVCGKGNNGGDGLVAARVLRGWGMRVETVELAGPVERAVVARAIARADLVIDAMYGTGFRGALDGDAAWLAGEIGASPAVVIAVDIPSGIDGATGAASGAAVAADLTVTFAARKPGVVFEPGRSLSGAVEVADIGISVDDDLVGAVSLDRVDVLELVPPRSAVAHKWAAAVMVVGGSGGMTGAPMLASDAAMRAGSGMVVCGLPGDDAAQRAAGGVVITRALPALDDGALAVDAVDAVLSQLERFRVLALGPGLGRHPDTQRAVRELLAHTEIPIVLDADGLNALDGRVHLLANRAEGGAVTVVTPHDGEYRRLTGADVGADRVAAARSLADRSNAVVLLKGPTTVVAAPGVDPVYLNPTGTQLLATAGTGDVLTGVVAAFIARGAALPEAAAAAAWAHGRAAELAAASAGSQGGVGVVAGDVVAALASTLAPDLDP
ncbi:MAG: NAD(P)H-hydrate dehydratase [Acidimicrobiia bacterium]